MAHVYNLLNSMWHDVSQRQRKHLLNRTANQRNLQRIDTQTEANTQVGTLANLSITLAIGITSTETAAPPFAVFEGWATTELDPTLKIPSQGLGYAYAPRSFRSPKTRTVAPRR